MIIALTVVEGRALGETEISEEPVFEAKGEIDPRADCDILDDPDDDDVVVTTRVLFAEIESTLDTDDELVTVVNRFEKVEI